MYARLFFHHFYVERDGYCVADHLVAAGESVAHVDDAEILTIDFCGGGGAAARAVHNLDGLGRAGYVEGDFFGDAMDGEVADHFGGAIAGADNFRGLKSDGGGFGDIE